MFALLALTVIVIALVMAAMAVGVILSGRCLRGSCGGPEVLDAKGESLSCVSCRRRKERERTAAASKSLLPTVS
ncbi:MAG: hypothetical protein HC897_08110 [Thermoanaerobaculia bacterium]|nr:hypothetical protein [Thermoanaerobaculia bacterium]